MTTGETEAKWTPPQNTCGLCALSHITGEPERALWDKHGNRFSKGGINRNDLWLALTEHDLTFGNMEFNLVFSNRREAKQRKLKELSEMATEGTYLIATRNHWTVLQNGKLLDPNVRDGQFLLGGVIGPNTQIREAYKIIPLNQ